MFQQLDLLAQSASTDVREECIGNQDPDPDDLKVSGLKGFVTDKQTVPSNLNRLQLARLLRETRGR